ncbi:hypothetical protein NC651_013284 [Populus alba x Populus x berolinensis]|nr:hypothetical protein NC651_013284 [Populus alba x Populus x berolinensis]
MATRAKHVHALGVRKTESVVVCVLQTLEARQVEGDVLHTLMTGRVCDLLDLVRHLFIYLFTLAAWFIVVHGGTSSNIGKLR